LINLALTPDPSPKLGRGERGELFHESQAWEKGSGIAATGTAAHVRALGCLPSKNMGAIGPTTNKNNVTIMTRSAIVSPGG